MCADERLNCAMCAWLGVALQEQRPFAANFLRANGPCCNAFNTQLRKVEAIEVHHLAPSGDKVVHELLLAVARCIDFGEGS